MALDLILFGGKLRRLREALEESVAELAQATGISEPRLESMEIGSDSPSGDEVLILADHFKQDFRFFISNEQRTALERTEKLFRAHSADLSKSDRRAIQEFLFLCDNEAFLLEELGRAPRVNFAPHVSGTYFRQHGWTAAHQLRRAFGYGDRDVPTDLFHDLRQLGFHVFRRRLENSNLSGLFIDHPSAGPSLLINYSEDVYRQRFTAAHEAAHAIFDRDDEFVVSFSRWSKDNLREVRADAFASAYLVPPELLRDVDTTTLNEARLLELADQLKVSARALVVAFIRDKRLTTEDGERFRHVRLPKNAKHDPELPTSLTEAQRARKLTMLQRGLSTTYVELCFEALQRNVVTRSKVSEMLLMNEAELGELDSLFRSGRR